MPQIDMHDAGAFCWIELATSDQNAGKAFYSKVFGWDSTDSPMAPGEFYTMFTLEGRNLGAAYTMGQAEAKMGVPPHWNLYIQVDSAEETAARAKELGGTVLAGPFDVMEHGRMAVVQDPTGAVFCIWEPKTHPGFQIHNQNGTFCWADLNSANPEPGKKFYSSLFGWTFEPGTGGYLHIKNGEKFIGGVPKDLPATMPSHWLIYIQTDDCDGTIAKVKAAGGSVFMEPTTMENVGRFAILEDPQHAAFAVFTPMRHE